jgi:hypothetical protein
MRGLQLIPDGGKRRTEVAQCFRCSEAAPHPPDRAARVVPAVPPARSRGVLVLRRPSSCRRASAPDSPTPSRSAARLPDSSRSGARLECPLPPAGATRCRARWRPPLQRFGRREPDRLQRPCCLRWRHSAWHAQKAHRVRCTQARFQSSSGRPIQPGVRCGIQTRQVRPGSRPVPSVRGRGDVRGPLGDQHARLVGRTPKRLLSRDRQVAPCGNDRVVTWRSGW